MIQTNPLFMKKKIKLSLIENVEENDLSKEFFSIKYFFNSS